jgi:hypothetical protein
MEASDSREPEINFSTITEDVIMDKSKGDTIAKLLVVMQTSWFMIQCVSRVAEGLPVTNLELTTLGHTVFVSVMYFFWWKKPLDVRYPIILRTRRRRNRDVAGEVSGADTSSTLPLIENSTSRREYNYQLSWRVRLGSSLPDRISIWLHRGSGGWLVLAFFVIASVTFGIIHCLGWNSHFLSHAEQTLWRISAVITVALPIALIADVVTFRLIVYHWKVIQVGRYIYVLARISLFTLSLLALRDLPFAAYQTPSWTNLIPHL